ncbi:YodC family protein [Halodesulfovibrio marinisediminis]|uniref:Uncharacterized conserved protein YodC, DUF2158 family n=1 Tax=Halodesulfovibrio marinisediminis DSM 17456 TaxID=1121457 RepID=A0A1N6DNN1_9BACT|nr:DUF2158 domain-containing protein [Halodesulfovibrio marinisediminis]SIN72284.1 Uncharacterized conserved protein YodC, DUF2158 family [Halodesulfovibrio marinisediminis DSM 17456]
MKFVAGDVIQLKSGGPEMTVIKFDAAAGLVSCSWFVGRELKTASFPVEAVGECKLFVEGAY